MADFIVLNTNDSGPGSLRQAIADAAAAPGADRVLFDGALNDTTITLTSGPLAIAGGRVLIFGDIDKDGTPDVTISGNDSSIIFSVASNGRLDISRLVLTDGMGVGANGVGQAGSAAGGAIVNAGTLTIAGSTFLNNTAIGGDGANANGNGQAGFAGGAAGGAILNSGSLTITGTVFETNSSTGGDGGDGGNGTASLTAGHGGTGGATAGAILNQLNGVVSLTNVSFVNSQVQGGTGGDGGDGSATGAGRRGGDGGNGSAYSPGIISYGAVTGSGVTSAGGQALFGPGGAGGTGGGGFPNGYNGSAGVFGSVLLGFGTYGNDTHTGFDSVQSIFALAGDDSVVGGAGLDYIDGGGDNDTLTGSALDQVYGSDGDDLIFTTLVNGAGIFDGQGAADTIDFTLAAAMNATYNLGQAGGFVVNGTTFRNFENVNGGAGNETVNGNSLTNALDGGTGNDTLNGGGGPDRLTGGDGNDTLAGGPGDDIYIDPVIGGPNGDTIVEVLSGGTADQVRSGTTFSLFDAPFVEILTLTGDAAIDGTGNTRHNEIRGNTAANVLNGDEGNDTISGSSGADTINGGGGADVLIGGKGNDRMNGGPGADVFSVTTPTTGNDTIAGFNTAEDRFDLGSGSFTAIAEIGGHTRLTHAGGVLVMKNMTGLTLDDWNSLVLPPGGGRVASGDGVPLSADNAYAPDDMGHGLPNHHLSPVTHADLIFA